MMILFKMRTVGRIDRKLLENDDLIQMRTVRYINRKLIQN